ncbi:kinase-like domain-containing protein [Xylaria bambusicola]|uniref:kinase-like domain-containing protein n=1 Tax=Xylaria bambusicola TaxID=326684 RepID=UPI002007E37B|nr:kinase-like domain-containing protein [Xylaria bambusicola]KAI0522250.1 kinase-like domain-containing protein [Xylaria bambusicola]
MMGGTTFGREPDTSGELALDHIDQPMGSPVSFDSPMSSEGSTPLNTPDEISADPPKRMPSLRSISDPQNPTHPMSASSTPLGVLSNARRPGAAPHASSGRLPEDLSAKMRAFHLSRQGSSSSSQHASSPSSASPSPLSPSGSMVGGIPSNIRLPGGLQRPGAPSFHRSAPAINPVGGGLAGKRRFGLKLGDMNGGPSPAPTGSSGLSQQSMTQNGNSHVSQLKQFEEYIDTEKGYLTFKGKAIITNEGVDFSDGSVFRISLDEVEKLDELGKGNYGTVYKVRHTKPRIPRFGPGLAGSKTPSFPRLSSTASDKVDSKSGSNSGKVMAMKEMRLELDETKLTTIIKELVILHECASPYVIDFYGAFFQESAVYMCIEYMDGGSIDKLYSGGIPENILRKITYSTIMGLKELKEKHNIIHRDVKPTNILINTRGQVKICDFGVSGNLVASIAKTNIGCQSYMAPERISGGAFMQSGASDGTYSVQSDIWSLGLTIIECGMGEYPYPPDVSSTIFSQLTAIVEGDPPDLPDRYSQTARTFVHQCLNKSPSLRPNYQKLLTSEWLSGLSKPETITEEEEEAQENDASAEAVAGAAENVDLSRSSTEDAETAAWVKEILEKKANGQYGEIDGKPALHAAQLDKVVTSLTSSPNIAS